jgi:hypothetical protein
VGRAADNLANFMWSLSGSLNLLETSRPFNACNGIALPLPFTFSNYIMYKLSNGLMKDKI